MSRPESEAEYLARMIPTSVAATSVGRRTLFRGALGAGAALGGATMLSACGSDSSSTSASSAASAGGAASSVGGGEVTFGSNQSDEVPKKGYQAMADAYKAASGTTVKINTVEHNTFQENINTYLQGKPDDVFTWFAGYRMRFFAGKGLAGDISDVWAQLQGYTDGFKTASTGDDGKQYFVPVSYYPWAVFYRPSVFEGEGLRGAQDPRRAEDARGEDAEGRPGPDRLRRQGRLAGDGHLRHPQHADQRLPVPRRPDGAQGSPGTTPR